MQEERWPEVFHKKRPTEGPPKKTDVILKSVRGFVFLGKTNSEKHFWRLHLSSKLWRESLMRSLTPLFGRGGGLHQNAFLSKERCFHYCVRVQFPQRQAHNGQTNWVRDKVLALGCKTK